MFPKKRFYITALIVTALMIGGYIWLPFYYAAIVLLCVLICGVISESGKLWTVGRLLQRRGDKPNVKITATRNCAIRFSNGDNNDVSLNIENLYPFDVNLEIIDEIPVVFQRRDILFRTAVKTESVVNVKYKLRPVTRGEYGFGHILIYASTKLGLLSRRFRCGEPVNIAVYPSFVMLHQYEFLAIHNNLTELGIKKIRRIGHNTEFESVREYIKGDDYRTINWKATARRHLPMVNVWQDERSQQIYSIIDKGRIMQNSFNGMTLLDYAINASLVMSFVAIRKDDKAGLATFAENFETFVPASKQTGQMQQILESLYRQQTVFGESDYSSLYVHLNKHISKRSLLIVYTNFATLTGINRQIEYLRQLAHRHVVLTVFFEDVEMKRFAARTPSSIEGYYEQIVADKFIFDKRTVAFHLRRYGIYTMLTEPDKLSVNVINKYLEMKAGGVI
ncbi:MAG: DUF58 domain-containing protein [Tannerella sp.]|jgi:uncharacterized protein (DUF58 family)|nr:DUF58 domain-containing protein [Tannerella sp.]